MLFGCIAVTERYDGLVAQAGLPAWLLTEKQQADRLRWGSKGA